MKKDYQHPFHVMAKPRGAICNLNCAYCYYLEKTDLYPGSNFTMEDHILEAFIQQYIAATDTSQVTFTWQGGEPTLMGWDFYRKAVALQEKHRKPGMQAINTLQTNGATLNDQWCAFFKEHNFLVGISLDGPQDLHDEYRVDKGGASTFSAVMSGIELLQKHQVDFNILACVNAATAQHPLRVYRFLRDEVGTKFLQFIPIVQREQMDGFRPTNTLSDLSVDGKAYGDFLIAIFEEWAERDIGRVFVQIFDIALGVWAGYPAGLCVFSPNCGDALALEHNGDLYACDHFVEPGSLLGNILDEPLSSLANSSRQRKFGLAKEAHLPAYCRRCRFLFICRGGCPKDRFFLTPDGEPGLNALCEGYQAFFNFIDQPMWKMARDLHSGSSQ